MDRERGRVGEEVVDEEEDVVGRTVCQCVYYSYLLHVVIMIFSLADG